MMARSLQPRASGFTLIELLVVMALIAVLSVGIGFALGGGNEGTSIRSAESLASSLFHATRAQAVLQQSSARLIVLNESSEPERHLRLIGIVFEDPLNPGQWMAANDGVLLPPGTYFWEDNSTPDGTMRIEFPLREPQTEGGGEQWFYYEFDALGHLVGEGRFVVGALQFDPAANGNNPPFDPQETPIGGVMVYRLGAIEIPADPDVLRR